MGSPNAQHSIDEDHTIMKSPTQDTGPVPQELLIEAGRTEKHYWKDLWRYRELFGFLAWRDLLVRYKQTALGIIWALLRPLLTMVVFTVIFGKIAKLPSDGIPYPVLVFAGMLPWTFFSSALSEASSSLVANSNLITKIYFPRIILPVSSVVVAFVDFLISFVLLIGVMIFYGMMPGLRLLAIIPLTALAFLAALGPGLLITALNVKYRDFRYIIPFIVQFGLYISPVGFSSSMIPENYRLLYSLNPVVSVIDGFRWAINGSVPLHWGGFLCSVMTSVCFLMLGIYVFRRTEKTFADVI